MRAALFKGFRVFRQCVREQRMNETRNARLGIYAKLHDSMTLVEIKNTREKFSNEVLQKRLRLAAREHKIINDKFENRWIPGSAAISGSLIIPFFWTGLHGVLTPSCLLTMSVLVTSLGGAAVCIALQALDRTLAMEESMRKIMILREAVEPQKKKSLNLT